MIAKINCGYLTESGLYVEICDAGVVKLVDARHSKCRSLRSVGSSPTTRTIDFTELFSLYARLSFRKLCDNVYAALNFRPIGCSSIRV